MKKIAIIQGHPDKSQSHLCHALADAYRSGAYDAGFDIQNIEVANLDFPLIRSQHEFEQGEPPSCIKQTQSIISLSHHIVLLYPLWLGTMPALLKGFLEQVFRNGYAMEKKPNGLFTKKLSGRSARVVVTMGMPVLAYRWFFGAHSLKNLERNILKFSGIKPIRKSLFGMVDDVSTKKREQWLKQLRALGAKGI